MTFRKHVFQVAACAITGMALASSARAQFTGSGGFKFGNQDATRSNFNSVTPQFTFTANGINFNSSGNNYTVGKFIKTSGTLTSTSGTSPENFASSVKNTDLSGFAFIFPYGTFMQISGTSIKPTDGFVKITHDDGVELYINGSSTAATAYKAASLGSGTQDPSEPTDSQDSYFYVGNAGSSFSFDLIYDECCGGPAKLISSDLLAPAPEPSSLALLGAGILGLAGAAIRRRKQSSAHLS